MRIDVLNEPSLRPILYARYHLGQETESKELDTHSYQKDHEKKEWYAVAYVPGAKFNVGEVGTAGKP